ncbi:MAG: family 43 glycosylhydrolase, partial [Duncaniella sp.]|nr:family 43 glycosylhydrolase [Duncaniella sp.]
YVEGPWLHKYNDTYYLTYASMGPGKETISYATAPSMKGPWTPQGELTGVAQNSFTIHPGIIEFNGTWYLFYHNAVLEIDGHKGAIGRRSVCVDTLTYDSVTGLMNPVVQKVAKEFTVDNEIAR